MINGQIKAVMSSKNQFRKAVIYFPNKLLKEEKMKIIRKLQSILKNEKGQTMIEYALVAVLIAIVLVFLFLNAGVKSGISGAGSKVASALK